MTAIPASQTCPQGASWLKTLDRRVAKALRELAFRPYAASVALGFLCCILFVPGIVSLPVTDRDEARFAQSSKQMLESGDVVDIHFQDEPRYKKPIGIYWLQSAAVSVASLAGAAEDDIWAYRIPSFLGALGAVLLTFWASRAIVGRENALAASALLATCLMLSFESRIAKSDAALIATIALAQGALFRLYMAPPGTATRGLAALFWLGLGAGTLIKGPVAPGLALATAIAALIFGGRKGWLKNLHWSWGVSLFLVVTLPWFIAIGISSHGAFFKSSLGDDFAGKIQSGQEAHGAPPGFYLVAFWLTFWPATLWITFDGLKHLWRMRRTRRTLFLLAWIVPWWFLIEAIPTKLPHYALPLYPAIALAAVQSARPLFDAGIMKARLAAITWSVIAVLLAIFLLALTWLAEAPQMITLAAVLIGFAAAAALTVTAAWRGFWYALLCGTVASAALFYIAAFRISFPSLEPIWISRSAAAATHALEACSAGPVAFAGFSEPSAVFLNGTKTILTGGAGAAQALASRSAGLAFVNWRQRDEFETVFQQKAGIPPHMIGCADGININGAGPTRLQVYVSEETAKASAAACSTPSFMVCAPKDSVRWRRVFNSSF